MRKTDKKMDNNIRRLLTDLCECEFKDIDGFLWVTHDVNFAQFPKSLKIELVFDSQASLDEFKASGCYRVKGDVIGVDSILTTIEKGLKSADISVKNITEHVRFKAK